MVNTFVFYAEGCVFEIYWSEIRNFYYMPAYNLFSQLPPRKCRSEDLNSLPSPRWSLTKYVIRGFLYPHFLYMAPSERPRICVISVYSGQSVTMLLTMFPVQGPYSIRGFSYWVLQCRMKGQGTFLKRSLNMSCPICSRARRLLKIFRDH
jgi:hypothetical protein